MTVTRSHGLYGVKIGATVLGGITQQAIQMAPDIGRDGTSGDIYPRHQSLRSQKPSATFTTKDIETALGLIGLIGVDISALTGDLTLFAQSRAVGNARSAGSTHRSYTMANGIAVMQRLSVSHQQDAELSYLASPIAAGAVLPITEADTVAVPSNGTDALRFALGKTTLESVLFTHVQQMDIDFGIVLGVESSDGDIHDTFVSIQDISPVITLSGIDVEWLKAANIPSTGLACTHANSTIYLRQRTEGNSFWADGSAKHIKMTIDGLAIMESIFDASGNERATTSMRIPLRYDGTNVPIVITTGQMIA